MQEEDCFIFQWFQSSARILPTMTYSANWSLPSVISFQKCSQRFIIIVASKYMWR